MKKFFLRFKDINNGKEFPWIIIFSAFFLCGVIAGCISATNINESASSSLKEYISNYITMVKEGNHAGSIVGYAFYNAYKYHTAVFLCGFSVLGVLLIPAILTARGFFLSFFVTVFVRLYGYNGLLFAAGVFGVQCLISLPFLLFISAQAFLASTSLASVSFGIGKAKGHPIFNSRYFFRFCVCVLALLLCVLFETLVSPIIAKELSGYIL